MRSRPVAALALFAMLAVAALPAPAAAHASEQTTHHEGVLSGSGFGLHVAKDAPWRAMVPFEVAPGAENIALEVDGQDVGFPLTLAVRAVDPDGEVVMGSPYRNGPHGIVVGWEAIRARGFGTWTAVVECDLCIAATFSLDATVTMVERGANLTLDDAHVLVVPGEPTRTGVTILNTGAHPERIALTSPDLPAGWTLALPRAHTIGPGGAPAHEIAITPPDCSRATFQLEARGEDGSLLDVATIEAACDPHIAQLRAAGHAVVAIVEFANANPYHVDFRGPASIPDHPEFLAPDLPADARELRLTLDAPTYADAVAADAGVWAAARPDTLYYVPGTRFVGFISFGSPPAPDAGGHSTGTTSLAAGTLGEAPDAYIVSVGGDWIRGVRWAARQPWIDAISMSLGIWAGTSTVAPGEPAGAGSGNLYVPFSIPYAQKLAYESGKRTFTGSSGGWGAWVGTSDGTIPSAGASGYCPYTWTGDFTGSPWTFSVETYWPWTELPWRTSCNPDIVAQGWDLVAASPLSLAGHNAFGHASGATPQAAGAYVRVVQEARDVLGSDQVGPRVTLALLGEAVLAIADEDATLPTQGPLADGVLTTREAEAVFLHAFEQVDVAESFLRHGDDERWTRDATPVPPGGEFAYEGYGILNDDARATMISVVRGESPDALRPDDDAAYLAGWAARYAFWEPQMREQVWVF